MPRGTTLTSTSVAARGRPWPCTGSRRLRPSWRAADFVMPDDIKGVAQAVLPHRLIVNLDRSLHGATAEAAVAAIIGSVAAPPILGD